MFTSTGCLTSDNWPSEWKRRELFRSWKSSMWGFDACGETSRSGRRAETPVSFQFLPGFHWALPAVLQKPFFHDLLPEGKRGVGVIHDGMNDLSLLATAIAWAHGPFVWDSKTASFMRRARGQSPTGSWLKRPCPCFSTWVMNRHLRKKPEKCWRSKIKVRVQHRTHKNSVRRLLKNGQIQSAENPRSESFTVQ